MILEHDFIAKCLGIVFADNIFFKFMPDFSDILIPNSSYVLLGEIYHVQILIRQDYKVLTHLLLRKLQMMLQIKCPNMCHVFQYRFH